MKKIKRKAGNPRQEKKKSKPDEWRVEREKEWRILDPSSAHDQSLLLKPKESEIGDSVMMSDACFIMWMNDAISGDAVRTNLYDLWYFHSEHTAPNSSWKMQAEVEAMLLNSTNTRDFVNIHKMLSKVVSTRRSFTNAAAQKLRSCGVTIRDAKFELRPGELQQVVCPVAKGDMVSVNFHSERATVGFQVDFLSVGKEVSALSEPRDCNPQTPEISVQGWTSCIQETGEVVLTWKLGSEAEKGCLLSMVAAKRSEAAVIRNRDARQDKTQSPFVCAGCGFSQRPPSLITTNDCLVCSCVESLPRKDTQPPVDPSPPGTAAPPFPTPAWFPKTLSDKLGVFFSISPACASRNQTAPDYGSSNIVVDLYHAPLLPAAAAVPSPNT
eukprot:TRINITY_DN22267_c0_g1_i1.p1 TRINITY_DN22267_c0_g1~~TRINITY_DN22267_c0_g1_i1.p1  ORF type:complete len:383 (+),score=78.01 TRINITY_DN22267_c0_g1_i1:83-1231(+)